MSLKDLEKYQDTGRRTPTDFNAPDIYKSYEQQKIEKIEQDIRIEKTKIYLTWLKKSMNRKDNLTINRTIEESLEQETNDRDNTILDTLDYLTYDER